MSLCVRTVLAGNAHGEQIKAAFEAAGIRSKGHMIRHWLLGHKSVITTERHYAKWVEGRQDRLDALVSATWTK